MSTLIYNDYKLQDYFDNTEKITNKEIIVNNTEMTGKLVYYLNKYCKAWWYCLKLYKGEGFVAKELTIIAKFGIKNIAVDAENYTVSGKPYMEYSKQMGKDVRQALLFRGVKKIILLPEGFGGARYKNYTKFVWGLWPSSILMERLYTQIEPWNMIYYYYRNKLRYFFIFAKTYLGIWPEAIPKKEQAKQLKWAQKLSGNKIFWYSETKAMPKDT